MATVPEYRVIYRRDGGQRQYRVFQRRGTVIRFMTDLVKDTRVDLAPIVEIYSEVRQCGPWSEATIRESETVT